MKNKLCKMGYICIFVIVFFSGAVQNLRAATGSVNAGEVRQTIEGFGASVAWYCGWLTAHPNKEDIYEMIFFDLGLDILRFRNTYRYTNGQFAQDEAEMVEKTFDYADHTIKVMISSWSPPATLKSNDNTEKGGTLKKTDDGFVYDEFALYWYDALDNYERAGVIADYISIQNEPGFTADWESCVFKPYETSTNAGYDRALEAVHNKLSTMEDMPKMLGPEVLGIGYNTFQNYAQRFNHDLLYGYAHHLYHGGDGSNPDSYITNMTKIAEQYPDKPRFQTEYDGGDWFDTAWFIHNSLVYEEVAGYLYWDLIWGGGKALVTLENPWDEGQWTTPDGYTLTEAYYAFRQYSKYIYPGWRRLGASVDSDDLRISAFLSSEGDSLSVVLLNVGENSEDLSLNFDNFSLSGGEIVRTSETEFSDEIGQFQAGSALSVPARSITTLALTGQAVTGINETNQRPSGFILRQNYPNPFNPVTTIHYAVPKKGKVSLKVFDVLGHEVVTLVDEIKPSGEYKIQFDGGKLASGLYFYRLQQNNLTETKKFILLR